MTLKSIKRFTLHCVREAVQPYCRTVSDSRGVATLAVDLIGMLDHEVVIVLLLDAKNSVTGYTEVARGSISQAIIYPREVLRVALVQGATSVILVHNHPSGDVAPSQEDRAITERVRHICRLCDVNLLDHVIVAHDGTYFSFCDAGLLAGEAAS